MVNISPLSSSTLAVAELGLSTLLLSFTAAVALYRQVSGQSASSSRKTEVIAKDEPSVTAIADESKDGAEGKETTEERDNTRDDEKTDLQKTGNKHGSKDIELMDQILVVGTQVLASTYFVDLALIGYQSFIAKTFAVTPLLVAKALAWAAFTLNWSSLRSDASIDGTKLHWVDYLFGWIALVGSSFLAQPFYVYGWNLIVSGAYFEKDSKADVWTILTSRKDILEQVQIGIFALRYVLLWTVGLLSAIHLSGLLDMNDLNVPTIFLKSPFSSPVKPGEEPTISTSQRERLKELDEYEKAESEALKGFWGKTKLAILLSYPWGERRLQVLIMVKFVLMTVDRVINLLVPIQTERILRSFSTENTNIMSITKFDAWSVILYIMYSYLQRSSGVLSMVQRLAWEPVSEFCETSITLKFFEHVHNMSMQFHIDRKSGEIMNGMQRGVDAMQSISTTVLFRLLPTIADVVIAIVYFWVVWGWKYGAIVTFNSALYLIVSAYTTKRRSRFYREWIEVDDGSRGKAMDSLTNYETVKYFTAESFEVSQYRKGFEKARGKSFEMDILHELLDMLETFVWTMNSLAGCMLCAYEISKGERNIGSFMSFIVYSRQLEGPVDSMAWYFKSLRRDFVSMEKILKLLNEEPTVKDILDAEPLIVSDGEIVFDNVSFQYDSNKKGLSNISFTAPKGKTVAIVGPTGSGKSTLLRLVFRFWDPTSGRILIDGQDIAKTTQLSLRKLIGVVPQEAVLFDDSIAYNIHYGRVSASREEIVNAAKAAQIHESILKFKDGYDTTVGERGAKLSGGEKQRIALARTILKNPRIVLLDEATSALDSATESQIQSTLSRMTENRTTLVVAHRLSTVMNADLILCIRDGEIVERGTHAELLQKAINNGGEGEYYKMWKIQLGEAISSNVSTASSNVSTVADDDDEATPAKDDETNTQDTKVESVNEDDATVTDAAEPASSNVESEDI